jgi:hypothetical protein
MGHGRATVTQNDKFILLSKQRPHFTPDQEWGYWNKKDCNTTVTGIYYTWKYASLFMEAGGAA